MSNNSSRSTKFLLLLEGWGLFKQSYEPWGKSSGRAETYTDDEVKRKGTFHLSTLAGISDHRSRVDSEHQAGRLSDAEHAHWHAKLNKERDYHEQEFAKLKKNHGFDPRKMK